MHEEACEESISNENNSFNHLNGNHKSFGNEFSFSQLSLMVKQFQSAQVLCQQRPLASELVYLLVLHVSGGQYLEYHLTLLHVTAFKP